MLVEIYQNGVKLNLHPIYGNITFNRQREKDEFYFRETLDGNITFVRGDYDLLSHSPYTEETEFVVKVWDGATLIGQGKFMWDDMSWNADDRSVVLPLKNIDMYEKLLNGMDNEYNIVKLLPAMDSINMTKRAIYQFYVLGDVKITNVIGNLTYEADCEEITDPSVLIETGTNKYNFALLKKLAFFKLTWRPESSLKTQYPQAEGIYWGMFTSSEVGIEFTNGNGYHFSYPDLLGNGDLKDSSNNHICYLWRSNTDPSGDLIPLLSSQGSGTQQGDCPRYNRYVYARVLSDTQGLNFFRRSEDDITDYNLNYRFVSRISTLGGESLDTRVVESHEVQDAETEWGTNADGKYFVAPTPQLGARLIPIGRNMWSPSTYWLNLVERMAFEDDYDTPFVLKDAYDLVSVIERLLQEIDPSIEGVWSTFLTDDYDPIVSGLARRYYITPITNLKKTYYDYAAQRGTITLRMLLNLLKSALNCYWRLEYIEDEARGNGYYLRIEHLRYFYNGDTYNPSRGFRELVDTTSLYQPRIPKPWSFGQNVYTFDKSLLAKRIEFSWGAECSAEFDGFPIIMTGKNVDENNKISYQAQGFVSDVDMVIAQPDSISDDLFAFIQADIQHNCEIVRVNLDSTRPVYYMQNGYLSYIYLEKNYWREGLSSSQYEIDGIPFTALSRKRYKKQTISFPYNFEDVRKTGIIKTGLGHGEIDKLTMRDSKVATCELLIGNYIIHHPLVQVLEADFEDSEMDFTDEETNEGYKITIDGHQITETASGYVRINVTAPCNVRIESSIDNDSIGWFDINDMSDDPTGAEYRVIGVDEISFDVLNGEWFIGFYKNMEGEQDKITFYFTYN